MNNMKDKIKKILYAIPAVAVIVLLGFVPTGQKPVLPLTVYWGGLGTRLAEAGVIDSNRFLDYYNKQNLEVTPENSRVVLNTLWAFGLANKNPILESGPMMDQRYGGAGGFASTGGWTLAKGSAMEHYGMHSFVTLTVEQQALVEQVAKNIYRPCCNNPTYFPDCNHGMAMLGLLELMASQGASEAQMYKTALEVNSLWFPSQYETIKVLLASKGVDWDTADPKEILGFEYSSASGFQKVVSQVKPQELRGTSCGA